MELIEETSGEVMTGIFVIATYNPRHDYWYLARGTETFYDERRFLRTWETKQEAIDWLIDNHPEFTLVETDD